MSKRRTKEERAAALEAKALWARAEAEAGKRNDVQILLRAVRDIDFELAEHEGANGSVLPDVRRVCVSGLKALGVELP
jgi:hypothetical protein